MVQEKLYTVAEVLNIIPVSRSGLYAALKRGEIASVGVGRRVLIPSWAIEKLTKAPSM